MAKRLPLGLTLVLALACALLRSPTGAHSALADEPAPTLTQQLFVGGVARDGVAFRVTLSAEAAYQGGAIMVTANDGVSGTASVFGRSYPLDNDGTGLAAIVGFGTEDPPGSTAATITVTLADSTVQTVTRSVTVLQTHWTVDYIVIPPQPPGGGGDDGPPLENEQPRLDRLYAGVSPRRWHGAWTPPVSGPIVPGLISSYFGEQRSFNGGPVQGHHGGTDFAEPEGADVFATSDGVVVLSGRYLIRGNLVVIDHGGGVFSSYGHLSERLVAEGDVVKQGQLIGKVGTTGLSTGPHLHWEMSVGGVLVDGLRWLDGTQGF